MINFLTEIPHIESVLVSDLIEKYSTPLYVYSATNFLENANKFRDSISFGKKLICYAVKANPNLSILKLITSQEGYGADCTSLFEIRRALHVGVAPDKIILDGPAKSDQLIRFAIENNIKQINAESECEVQNIQNQAVCLGKVCMPVALRINTDTDVKAHKYLSTGTGQNKFGVSIDQAMNIVKNWTEKYPNLMLNGVMVHFGSQISNEAAHVQGLETLKRVLKNMQLARGIKIQTVDVGGGVGINYHSDGDHSINLKAYGANISQFMMEAAPNAELILEPGRAIVGNAGCILTKVLCIKPCPNSTGSRCVLLDAGMGQLIRPALYSQQHTIVPVLIKSQQDKKTTSKNLERFLVGGPVCESADVFGTEIPLVPSVSVGDVLAILDTGAYGSCMSSRYNGQPLHAEVLVHGDQHTHIAKRETLEDTLKREMIL